MAPDTPILAFSGTYAKYLHAPAQSAHVTLDEAEALARDLAAAVTASGYHPQSVVGLANGAIFPAKVVADALGIPFHIVRVRRKGSRYKQRLRVIKDALHIPSGLIMWGPIKALWVVFQNRTSTLEEGAQSFAFDVAGQRVLMVDDCVETGASFRYVEARLRAGGAVEIRTAVYCWSDMPNVSPDLSRPDVYLHREIQYYPWSNNSRHLGRFHDWLKANGLSLWT